MIKAIFRKEWLKTRNVFWVALAAAVLFAVYAIMGIRRVTATHGVDHVWLIMLMKDQTFVDAIKYLPAVIGLALGAAQMMPEMQQKRLKLTLHLPYPQYRMVGLMLLAGLVELLVVFGIQFAIIGFYYSTIITREMTRMVLLTTLPWYLAGFNAYLFTAAVCLEGTWRRRVVLGLMGLGCITVWFMQPVPMAYNGIIIGSIVFTMLLMALSIASVNRFKEGRID